MSAVAEHFIDEAKALACVHCGLCLSSCPTYLETGNENNSPRGRIYLMRELQNKRIPLGTVAVRHLDLCLGCRACESACPSGVEYGELLEHTRDHVERKYSRGWFQSLLRRVAIEQVFPFPWRLKLCLLPGRMAKVLGLECLLPRFASDALDLLPEKISGGNIPETSAASGKAKGRIGFIEGCVMQVMFADTNRATLQLLNEAGWEVVTPSTQSCCGALYAHSGQLEKARECARKNIALYEKLNLDLIITNAAGCGSTLKGYGSLLANDRDWAKRAETFSAKVRDLTEHLNTSQFVAGAPNLKVTYHDACHLAHPQGITAEPRALVKAVSGNNFVELPESDVCCGSAGSYNLTEPEMAARLQRRKINNIISTGADVVVTSNPGCLLQIQSGLKKAGAKVRVIHIADFLATGLSVPPSD